MKKISTIKYILVLILPLLFFFICICSINPSPEFRYTYLKKNCSAQSLWMYKKLYKENTTVSSAFFGSSHTLQGINDSLLPNTVNFGYCRFGRDIQLALFKDVLERKKIKTAFFEIAETEPSYSHPDYPFLGTSSDIFPPSLIYNQSFSGNRYDAFLFRLAYVRSKLFSTKTFSDETTKSQGYIGHDGIAEPAYMESEKKAKLKDLKDYNPNSLFRKTELSFSSYYLTEIKKLAEINNCKVYFLYLPAYGNDLKNSFDSVFYKPFFPTLIPPDSILNVSSNWHDAAHLNDLGSKKMCDWLLQTKIISR